MTVRDVTEERTQAQKLEAIHKAGLELADLKPEEVFEMGVEERIELLKSIADGCSTGRAITTRF